MYMCSKNIQLNEITPQFLFTKTFYLRFIFPYVFLVNITNYELDSVRNPSEFFWLLVLLLKTRSKHINFKVIINTSWFTLSGAWILKLKIRDTTFRFQLNYISHVYTKKAYRFIFDVECPFFEI